MCDLLADLFFFFSLKEKLQEVKPERADVFKTECKAMVEKWVGSWKDLSFFFGELMLILPTFACKFFTYEKGCSFVMTVIVFFLFLHVWVGQMCIRWVNVALANKG